MPSGVTAVQQRSTKPRTWWSQVRRLSITKHRPLASFVWRPVTVLEDARLESFRRDAFHVQRPVLMPPRQFTYLPAVTKWFKSCSGAFQLDYTYLRRFGDAVVPLELSTISTSNIVDEENFQRSGLDFPISDVPLHVNHQQVKSVSKD